MLSGVLLICNLSLFLKGKAGRKRPAFFFLSFGFVILAPVPIRAGLDALILGERSVLRDYPLTADLEALYTPACKVAADQTAVHAVERGIFCHGYKFIVHGALQQER